MGSRLSYRQHLVEGVEVLESAPPPGPGQSSGHIDGRPGSVRNRLSAEQQPLPVVFQELIDTPGEILEHRAVGGEYELGGQLAN